MTWNLEGGYVNGTIRKVHTKGVDYEGHVHHATPDDPHCEIDVDKTDHIALHRSAASKKSRC